MKVVRTLVYDGPEEWITKTLANSYVGEDGINKSNSIGSPIGGQITETDREIFPDPKPLKLNW